VNAIVDNVVITGASKFVVVSVVANPDLLTAVIDISLDVLKLVGDHYVLDGSLNGLLDLWGEGSLR
jgi:hypothetical protein